MGDFLTGPLRTALDLLGTKNRSNNNRVTVEEWNDTLIAAIQSIDDTPMAGGTDRIIEEAGHAGYISVVGAADGTQGGVGKQSWYGRKTDATNYNRLTAQYNSTGDWFELTVEHGPAWVGPDVRLRLRSQSYLDLFVRDGETGNTDKYSFGYKSLSFPNDAGNPTVEMSGLKAINQRVMGHASSQNVWSGFTDGVPKNLLYFDATNLPPYDPQSFYIEPFFVRVEIFYHITDSAYPDSLYSVAHSIGMMVSQNGAGDGIWLIPGAPVVLMSLLPEFPGPTVSMAYDGVQTNDPATSPLIFRCIPTLSGFTGTPNVYAYYKVTVLSSYDVIHGPYGW